MEQEWTEKEPVVSEWPYEKESKKDTLNAEQPPKLSMKMLYGMIQELQQYSERLAAKIDEFEIYMIQVQAARAQLEASAASTIAKAKAVSERHERTVAQNEAGSMNAVAAKQTVDKADLTAEAPPAGTEGAAAASQEEHALAGSAVNDSVPAMTIEEAASHDALTQAILAVESAVPVAADPYPEQLADHTHSSAMLAEVEAALAQSEYPAYTALPAGRESSSEDLMTLAMEVMGYVNDAHVDSFHEDGIDPGEGVNPFDPDGFATSSVAFAAAADASPERIAQSSSSSSPLSSPFFMPRSQRHQGTKKKFLNLFGFRTRIS